MVLAPIPQPSNPFTLHVCRAGKNPADISLAAAKLPAYQKLIDEAVEFGKGKSSDPEEQAENAMDRLLVAFGREILKIIPGRVSTEVDAKFSFDKKKTIAKAYQIISLYEELGVSRERILIKVTIFALPD